MQRILVLEPYYGGSHKHFLEGLQSHVAADYTLFTLPARKWKMRMQVSAIWFIDQLKALPPDKRRFDTVLLSSFVDAAVFRSMLHQVSGWDHQTSIVTYFHENQFVYPLQPGQATSHQFIAINFHSALASDSIAFNSSYNRDSFIKGCQEFQKRVSDMELPDLAQTLLVKSRILHPGIDFQVIDNNSWREHYRIPTIVWNHRWEHDKNPEAFFEALFELEKRGIEFQLLILGQSFGNCPHCFKEAELRFKKRIVHHGFADTYQRYAELLSRGDIVVSTARHEFFGIAVIEAVRAGCVPILPNRLSYPELFDSRVLYCDNSLAGTLEAVIRKGKRLERLEAKLMTERFSWQEVADDYGQWLFGR